MTAPILIRIALHAGGAYLLLNLLALLSSGKLIFAPQPSTYTHLPGELKIVSGNAEDLGNMHPFMQQFQPLGYSVLMYDYRAADQRGLPIRAKNLQGYRGRLPRQNHCADRAMGQVQQPAAHQVL